MIKRTHVRQISCETTINQEDFEWHPDPLGPVAPDGSHAQAFATHRARGNGIARFFALTRLLKDIPSQQAGEDNVHTLIAHFHMLSIEPGFAPPGQEPSATAAPGALRRLNRGNGLVGTKGASTERDYDMALKGLMILLYRYRAQLGPDLIDFIMRELIPDHMVGGHSPRSRSSSNPSSTSTRRRPRTIC